MITPKRLLFRTGVRFLEWLMMIRRPLKCCNLSLESLQEESLDLITVAFNNAGLLQYQAAFIDRFIKDPHTRIIVDNSSDKKSREAIYKYCKDNGIAYMSLPKNRLATFSPSYSHAAALNYAYKHIIRKRQPFAFGQIDHDLFPTRPVSIIEKLRNQPVYGPLRQRGQAWYLSAIMSFFRYDFVRDKKVDFMPVTPYHEYLDSGGGNWYDIYSRIDQSSLSFPSESVEPIREGGSRHGDCLEYFDDRLWIHTINGSCWKKIEGRDEKDKSVRLLLDSFLQ